MSYNTQRPHIAVYLLLEKDGKIAFVYRQNTSWRNEHYGLVAGKVETGETALQAAVREAKEEAGVVVEEQDLEHKLTGHRQNKGDHAPEWIDIVFAVKKWEGEVYNAEPEKHSKIEWLDPVNLPNNIVPENKPYLEATRTGKSYIQLGWEDLS